MPDHNEADRAYLIRCRREAKRAYAASEQRPEPITFAPLADGAEKFVVRRETDDDQQAQFLAEHGDCQTALENAFIKGLLAGGLVALTTLGVTLWFLGVL